MAIHVSCPLCRATLRLPDGCDGERAKCPSCQGEFVVPHPSPEASQEPIRAVAVAAEDIPKAVPLPAAVTDADVTQAGREVEQLAADDVSLIAQLADLERQRRAQANRLSLLRLFQSGRQALDHSVGRVGGVFLAITLVPAMLVVMTSVFSPSVLGYLIVAACGVALAGVVYFPFSVYPDDQRLATLIDALAAKTQAATALCEQARVDEAEARRRLQTAQANHQRLHATWHSQVKASESKV